VAASNKAISAGEGVAKTSISSAAYGGSISISGGVVSYHVEASAARPDIKRATATKQWQRRENQQAA